MMDKESQKIFEALWELHDRYDEDPKHTICGDGAEQIKKLCEKIDALKQQMPHWISVKDRLPKESQYRDKATRELIPILVCVKGTEYPFRAMYDGKKWGDGWCAVSVTHWMPLPESPEAGETE